MPIIITRLLYYLIAVALCFFLYLSIKGILRKSNQSLLVRNGFYIFLIGLILVLLGSYRSFAPHSISIPKQIPSVTKIVLKKIITPLLLTPSAEHQSTKSTLTPIPTETPDVSTPTLFNCDVKGGEIKRLEINTPYFSKPLSAQIYLPPCYENQASTPYPLLILLHGQGETEAQWVKIGAFEAADQLISSGSVPPFIIVLPLEPDSTHDPVESNYDKALTQSLLPFLEQNYSVCQQRSCRAIGGLSRGSGWALRLAFTDWETYGVVGVHSMSPFSGDIDKLPGWLASIPAGQFPKMFLDIGDKDISYKQAFEFEALMVSQKIPHDWYVFKGGHNQAYWHSHLMDYLRWYSWAMSSIKPPSE
jgi:enterochelin esterase-like enzyme